MRKPEPTKLENTLNWDYRIDKKYLNDPAVERWMLERQLNYGGDHKIQLRNVLKYWPDVRVDDPVWKDMIEHFLQSDYVRERIK